MPTRFYPDPQHRFQAFCNLCGPIGLQHYTVNGARVSGSLHELQALKHTLKEHVCFTEKVEAHHG